MKKYRKCLKIILSNLRWDLQTPDEHDIPSLGQSPPQRSPLVTSCRYFWSSCRHLASSSLAKLSFSSYDVVTIPTKSRPGTAVATCRVTPGPKNNVKLFYEACGFRESQIWVSIEPRLLPWLRVFTFWNVKAFCHFIICTLIETFTTWPIQRDFWYPSRLLRLVKTS